MVRQVKSILTLAVLFLALFMMNGHNESRDISAQINTAQDTFKGNSDAKTDIELQVEKAALEKMQKAEIRYVIDGDTFVLETGEKVRLIGLDTPEKEGPYTKQEPYGPEATAFAEDMLEGTYVYLDRDVSETDRYGRLLRYVYLEDGTFFNLLLLKKGYAKILTYPPDVKYADAFVEAEKSARDNKEGLWGLQ